MDACRRDLPQKEVKRVTLQASLDHPLFSSPYPPYSPVECRLCFFPVLALPLRCCFFSFCCSTANAKKYATKDEAQAKRKQHSHTQPNKHIQTQADRMSESQRFIHADDLSVSASPILDSPQSPVFQADSLSLQPAATYVPVSVWLCVCECAPLPTASFCFRFRKLSQLARHSQKETATKQGRIFWQFFCHTHIHVCPCESVGIH